ncbi:DNA mismatch repair protein-like protein [Plenodomus tracheiphilus IPT5]|uniref:DNA mismatch repair protein-like protein n=1 Tax=Plenodomus tracheiphilus IPT5 TaxID=1408161 RepID=A0A6A7ATQ5_9PLEO|nr:DNA mismatch repair protein-like protein [Plenodomus tracheiphilus IPT5]
MTQTRSERHAAPTPRDAGRCILALPDAVAAQIKSSTAIVSLSGVVLELLKNSLDARATSIQVAVDFARGGCDVEDDGVGIPPNEFREEAGLGKLYHTSKHNANEAQLGRNGTFLASLAAMSLLTITSHHQEYRSHNSITFHHSKVVERQLPAPASKEVHSKHGTRATVRNLFGNLPVRVKQRSAVLDQNTEHDRVCDALKRDVVALLLSWKGAVSLKIRDGHGRGIVNLNTSSLPDHTNNTKQHSTRLTSTLNILTQAEYIAVDEWPSWVPVLASTSAVSVKGAISLHPAPSKHVQFLSLGIRPILAEHGRNELYDEINRLFSLSSFGAIEDDQDLDEMEKTRRQNDKRFKSDGYTNRQLKARKDVDRYPMFHLRITVNDKQFPNSDYAQLGNESTLQSILEILAAMVTQWLSTHHFRPQIRRRKRDRPDSAPSIPSNSTRIDTPPAVGPLSTLLQPRAGRPSTAEYDHPSGRRVRPRLSTARGASEISVNRVFADWSRIKSGKPRFFDASTLSDLKRPLEPSRLCSDSGVQHSDPVATARFADFHVESVQRGALSMQNTQAEQEITPPESVTPQSTQDDTILWTDPATAKTYLLNARTGCVVPDLRSRPNTTSATVGPVLSQRTMNKSLRLPQRPVTASVGETPWLANVLQTWDNPVFKLSERRIQQVDPHGLGLEHGAHDYAKHGCSQIDFQETFSHVNAATTSGKLSKHSLQHAELISQVDKKFILVKLKSTFPNTTSVDDPVAVLILIDQHAADERIQVEQLFNELCTPTTQQSGPSSYKSKLGHRAQVTSIHLEKPLQYTISQMERTHFTSHASRFAAWGILFDMFDSTPSNSRSGNEDKRQGLLSVTTLPPAIAERCKADPKILISILRTTVWKYVEDPRLPPFSTPVTTTASTSNAFEEADWVRRLATCPSGLVDMVNSRACRSAIMFNDELDLEQCKELVGKLANCVFPFMCAHGRPSMVPLVDLGSLGDGKRSFVDSGIENHGHSSFVQAWKAWKQ